ncbi:MAG: DUF4352 domain-containing protein [Chloroflexi bacterium]|nr:DUF4352 domain-containing protein [Chloroflexota bacterium]
MRVLAGILAALAFVFVAACGGGDGGDAKSEAGLEKAVRRAAEGIFGGDLHDAYGAYSKECREETSYEEFAAGMKLAEAFMEAFTGAKLKDIEVKDVEVRNFSGDRGEVKLVVEARDIEGFDEGQEEEWSEWVWEDGKWVQTDCGDLGPGGVLGGGDDAAPSDDEPQPVPTPGAGSAIGTAVEAGGSRYTVHSIEDPAKAGEYFGPDPGKRWVVIEVTQEALDRQVSGSPFDFTIQDSDGFIYDFDFGEKEPEFSSRELAPGQRQRGFITFEVPEDAELVAVWVDADFPKPHTLIADLTRD